MATRVNTKFVVVLTAVLLVACAGVVGAFWFLLHNTGADLARMGDRQMTQAKYKEAGDLYAKAVNKDGPELDVSLDYLFAYAIEPPGRPDDWMRIVNEVVWTVAFASWQGVSSSFAPWVVTEGAGGVAGAQCDTPDGYAHPDYPKTAVPGATPSVTGSGKPVNPYVAGQPRSTDCQATTGT